MKKLFFIFLLLLLCLACGSSECSKNVDCVKSNFIGSCVEGKCVFEPKPNVCGNLVCDKIENSCLCPEDCGACSGKAGKYMEKGCVNKVCVTTVGKQDSLFMTKSARISSDQIDVTSLFKKPFNMAKDTFDIKVLLSDKKSNKRVLNRAQVIGRQDKQDIVLADVPINRQLWDVGDDFAIQESVRLKVPAGSEGLFSDMSVKLFFNIDDKDYISTIALPAIGLTWALPNATYNCGSCDDNNPGTKDSCVNGFCKHDAIMNSCGNFICDSAESQCSCPKDCGPCNKVTNYLSFACISNQCVSTIKATEIKPMTLYQETSSGGNTKFKNTYSFNSPFNANTDKLNVELTIAETKSTGITITNVLVLDSNKKIGELTSGEVVTDKIDLPVELNTGQAEYTANPTVNINFKYTDSSGQTKSDKITYSLGKLVVLRPEI